MELREVIAKLRKFEILIRKAVDTQMHGDFNSIFKGSGLEFDDVRAYQYGDDVRTIDWNVSAKGQGTYIKTFKEEKEQNVFFILDVSASQFIGKPSAQKIDIAKEICGVLTFSAIKENSSVGLLCYSSEKERYIKPKKGIKHAFEIIGGLYRLETKSLKTNLQAAMAMAMSIIKRKSIIVLISDFVDTDYEQRLKGLAKRHDLIVIHLADIREFDIPNLGIVPIYDKESQKTVWKDTSSKEFRLSVENFKNKQATLQSLCRQNKANYLYINTSEEYLPKLIKLFNIRNRTKK